MENSHESDEESRLVKNRIITFPPVDERIQFLAQLPGVGLESAESLLTFAGVMEDTQDTDGYGTLAEAIHWVSILSQIGKEDRPKNWKGEKILTIRKFLGLKSNEYIKIESEGDIE